MSDDNRPRTVDAVRAQLDRARAWIDQRRDGLGLEATIDDYPIGRRDRGRCRLGVERAKAKGYRTVRQTTDKNGRWCTPKKSTFRDALTVVVRDGLGPDRSCWLSIGAEGYSAGVYAQAANGDNLILAQAPCWSQPSRTERRSVIVTTTFAVFGDGSRQQERTEHVTPADPAELCDAYDAWLEGVRDLRRLVANVWDHAPIPTA